jgi:hypothetical protein
LPEKSIEKNRGKLWYRSVMSRQHAVNPCRKSGGGL